MCTRRLFTYIHTYIRGGTLVFFNESKTKRFQKEDNSDGNSFGVSQSSSDHSRIRVVAGSLLFSVSKGILGGKNQHTHSHRYSTSQNLALAI